MHLWAVHHGVGHHGIMHHGVVHLGTEHLGSGHALLHDLPQDVHLVGHHAPVEPQHARLHGRRDHRLKLHHAHVRHHLWVWVLGGWVLVAALSWGREAVCPGEGLAEVGRLGKGLGSLVQVRLTVLSGLL